VQIYTDRAEGSGQARAISVAHVASLSFATVSCCRLAGKDTGMSRTQWRVSLASIGFLCAFTSAAVAEWQIPGERIGRAEIRFVEGRKTVFSLACGHNILLTLRYPGKQGLKKHASVTIRNANTKIVVNGAVEQDDTFKEIMFSALWTGKTTDPADLDALMALFSSGQALTVSAEGKSYPLPAINPELLKTYQDEC
jgi:hypothetical protein